jgi:L-threonylcarbamoyladenylate synthase
MPQLLPTRTEAEIAAAMAVAAQRLAEGELVAFPTETVYGLGARADHSAAVARIFAAKGRPSDHPLIVHVADADAALAFAAELPPVAQRLVAAFWPGPLTVIVPRRAGVGAAAAGGQDSVGLRCPAHPLAQALLRAAAALGVAGIAAPSANRYGRISPTRAAHVIDEFVDLPDLAVIDGGDCALGIESAIVDCSRGHPVLLRPGSLGAAQIEAAAGEPLRERDAQAPRASGTLAAHYAPRAKVRLMNREQILAGLDVLQAGLSSASKPAPADRVVLAVYSRGPRPVARPGVLWRGMPASPMAVAHELFAVLRELDDTPVPLIWVEMPPADAAWDGVRDRLVRAAAA